MDPYYEPLCISIIHNYKPLLTHIIYPLNSLIINHFIALITIALAISWLVNRLFRGFVDYRFPR